MISLFKKAAILIALVAVTSIISKVMAMVFLLIGASTLIFIASTGNVKGAKEERIPNNAIDQLRKEVRNTMERNQKNER